MTAWCAKLIAACQLFSQAAKAHCYFHRLRCNSIVCRKIHLSKKLFSEYQNDSSYLAPNWPQSSQYLQIRFELQRLMKSARKYIFMTPNNLIFRSNSKLLSVSERRIQLVLNFWQDLTTLTVQMSVTNLSYQEDLHPAWKFSLSQKPEFVNNHLSEIPTIHNQQVTLDMRAQALSAFAA